MRRVVRRRDPRGASAISNSTGHSINSMFIVFRALFTAEEMLELLRGVRTSVDRSASDLISPQNLRCRYMPHHETGESLFEVFDPVNDISPVCRRFTSDRRILRIMESIYGEPALLFKEKLIFKPPGATGYKLHQDIPLSWRGFPRSFATVLMPIDTLTRENGCTEVFSGYHADFLSDDPDNYMLPDETVVMWGGELGWNWSRAM